MIWMALHGRRATNTTSGHTSFVAAGVKIPKIRRELIICPQVVGWARASGTTGGKGEVPSLAKEGWQRHQVNGPVPLEARPGWFVQLPIIGGLNQPPRLRPLRRLRGIF